MPSIESYEPMVSKRRLGCGCGGSLLFGLLLTGGIFALIIFLTLLESRPIPGDASNFDPIVAYEEIKAFAGDAVRLEQIRFEFVRSDGTMNLFEDYEPSVWYTFVHYLDRADDSPVGVPSSNSDNVERIIIYVERPGFFESGRTGNSVSYNYNFGMQRRTYNTSYDGETADAPICDLADLWQIAMDEEEAPSNAVATISYNSEGYRFTIQETGIRLEFNQDCQRTDA